MFVAGDEANMKAYLFSTASYFVVLFLTLVPLVYFVALSIWWIFAKKKLRLKLPCIRASELPQQEEDPNNENFPDRIEHPNTYQAAPLLAVQ